jgi:1-phosphatidylinositol phosphodiesterase
MHPGECIIMSVKEEYQPAKNTRSFEATFDSYLEGNRDRWYLGNTVPALGDVRGKIVLFRRFSATTHVLGIDASSWPDNATFAINNSAHLKVQDQYVVPAVSAIPKKWDEIKALLDAAGSATDDRWYVNFSSGTSGSAAAYPSTVAKGSPGITGENDHLHGYMSTPPVGNVGTILMDFPEYPDNLLIAQIIGLN